MNNKQYNELVAEIRYMCNGTDDQAKYVITLCTRLNANPYEFVKRLPQLTGKVKPSIDEVLKEMEQVAKKHCVPLGGITMPRGYQNREERRRAKRYGNA